MPELEVVPELVPLSVREVVADPVVPLLPLADPDMALFNFTCPLESRQWVAAETPEEAPGLDVGGEVVLLQSPYMATNRGSKRTRPGSIFIAGCAGAAPSGDRA